MEGTESRSKIFINPVFKKAHINPNFLLEKKATINHPPTSDKPTSGQLAPNIHFNPAFLERIHQQQQQEVERTNSTLTAKTLAVQPNPIIKHTKRKLVRASSAIPANLERSPLAPLVKISKNKLVRSSISTVATANPPHGVISRDVKKPYKVINSTSQLYKLDRRPVTKSKSLVRKISPQKFAIKDRKLLKLRNIRTPLKIVNVSYKESPSKPQLSGRFKLVNSLKSNHATNAVKSKDTCLKIRGTTFLLDPSGNKLRKVPSQLDAESKNAKFERVYIGGQPYVSKSDGTFERSKAEWYKTYLRWTKQKSINNLLNRNIKCNVPCPIFRRSGKCKNFSRGQCPKLHDPKHIIICPKFLRGECTNTDCLLSHNVSLEKMPVCRFFLEGRCSKNDCPYLHKKVSEKERICGDFLNGYCSLADKCQNRHIFICPDFDRAGVCGKTKCPYPHGRKNVQSKDKESKSKRTDVTLEEESELREDASAPKPRYFISNCDDAGDGELNNAQKAQRKRLLRQVEKMKRKHEDNETTDANMLGVHQEGTTNGEDNQTDRDNICEELDESEQDTPFRKRVKLGTLPSFIPI